MDHVLALRPDQFPALSQPALSQLARTVTPVAEAAAASHGRNFSVWPVTPSRTSMPDRLGACAAVHISSSV